MNKLMDWKREFLKWYGFINFKIFVFFFKHDEPLNWFFVLDGQICIVNCGWWLPDSNLQGLRQPQWAEKVNIYQHENSRAAGKNDIQFTCNLYSKWICFINHSSRLDSAVHETFWWLCVRVGSNPVNDSLDPTLQNQSSFAKDRNGHSNFDGRGIIEADLQMAYGIQVGLMNSWSTHIGHSEAQMESSIWL